MKPKSTDLMLYEMLTNSSPEDIWNAKSDKNKPTLTPEEVRLDISIFVRTGADALNTAFKY